MNNPASPAALFDEFKDYTMIPRERFIANIECATWLKDQPDFPNGHVVECGVWRGGMSAALIRLFGSERNYLLFDSFQGLPPPNENDGEDARWWLAHPEHPRFFENCFAPVSVVRDLVARDVQKGIKIKIIEGWFINTLPITSIRPIAFLHLDCDWYDSNYICLSRLWPHIQPGGGIIVDDYFDWEGCRRALHDFLSQVRAREVIERVGRTGGAFIRKRGPWDLSESPHLG